MYRSKILNFFLSLLISFCFSASLYAQNKEYQIIVRLKENKTPDNFYTDMLANNDNDDVSNIEVKKNFKVNTPSGELGSTSNNLVMKDIIVLKSKTLPVDKMINMVKDLETISALESKIIELQPYKFNIIDLAKEVMEFLEVKANAKKINLHFAKGLNQDSVLVVADRDRIKQVLSNLIDNAINYIGEAQNPYVKLSFYDMDEHFLVEISDNGIGISTENIPHLFDRFYRVDTARSRNQGGTGLGLSIVKHIIEAHKQTINVRSSIGIGTTFSFTLKKADY